MHRQVSRCGVAQRFRDLVQSNCTHVRASTYAHVHFTKAGLESCISWLYSQVRRNEVTIYTQSPVLIYR